MSNGLLASNKERRPHLGLHCCRVSSPLLASADSASAHVHLRLCSVGSMKTWGIITQELRLFLKRSQTTPVFTHKACAIQWMAQTPQHAMQNLLPWPPPHHLVLIPVAQAQQVTYHFLNMCLRSLCFCVW